MLPLSTLNSVKERGSNGALRSHLFAKGRTRRGGSGHSWRSRNAFRYNALTILRFSAPLGQCQMLRSNPRVLPLVFVSSAYKTLV